MNRFEDRIRETMQSLHEPVNPAHVAGFQDFLLDKKRKRRRLFIWYFLGFTTVAIALFVVSQLQDRAEDNVSEVKLDLAPSVEPAGAEEIQRKDQVYHQEESEISPADMTKQAAIGMQLVVNEAKETTNKLSETNTTSTSSARVREVGHISGRSKQRLEVAQVPNAKDGSEQVKDNSASDGAIPGYVHTKQQELEQSSKAELSSDPMRPNAVVAPVIPLVSINSLLNASVRDLIQPLAPTLKRKSPLEFGVMGAWFATQPQKSAGSTSGTGMQFGGHLTYALTHRLLVHAEGGFMYLNGGSDFDKQSVTTQLGFAQRSQTNALAVRSSYAWYAGLSWMYRTGRHSAELGVQVYHVYGARGDVTRTEIEDNQEPVTTELNDVWVVTDGLADLPAELTIGYRYRLNASLQLALRVRLPITDIQSKRTGTEYAYTSNRYRFAPQIGLYYRLNQ